MTIGIDIDDTITNSSEIFIKYARMYNAQKNINYEIDVSQWDQTKAFGWSRDNQIEFANMYLKKILYEAEPKKNAIKVINKLKDKGYKICFITARKDEEINNVYKFTFNWLVENNIKFDKLIVNSSNKLNDCIDNNVDIFIDDNYITCKTVFENLKIPVFMFSTNYNIKNFNLKFKRVYDWNEIDSRIEKLIIKEIV